MTALVLVGLMGTGKTTIGRMVAERTGRPFVDSDEAIEQRTGKTVRELWEQGGEAAYRQLESDVLLDAVARGTDVVAAAAGVVLDPVVRTALRSALVVWLRAQPSTLAGRVSPHDHRPLLGDHPLPVFEAQATERAPLYAEVADATIDVDTIDPEQAAETVVDLFHRSTADG